VTPVISQAGRASWQRQAAAELARHAFAAWRQALGLGECREQPGVGTSRLHAAGRSGGVTVRLTANVFEQEDA
jgi:hypothetical protein